LAEELVGAVDRPQRGVLAAHLGQAAVEVQQPHQAGPLGCEVRDGEDRAAVGAQPGQNVVAVLPVGGGHDQRGLLRDLLEDLHAHALGGMKPWPSSGSGSKARRTLQPAASTAPATIFSSSTWYGQAGTFALSRRSPLGMR